MAVEVKTFKQEHSVIMGTTLSELSPAVDAVGNALPFANEMDGQALADATLSPNLHLSRGPHLFVHQGQVWRWRNGKITWLCIDNGTMLRLLHGNG